MYEMSKGNSKRGFSIRPKKSDLNLMNTKDYIIFFFMIAFKEKSYIWDPTGSFKRIKKIPLSLCLKNL